MLGAALLVNASKMDLISNLTKLSHVYVLGAALLVNASKVDLISNITKVSRVCARCCPAGECLQGRADQYPY